MLEPPPSLWPPDFGGKKEIYKCKLDFFKIFFNEKKTYISLEKQGGNNRLKKLRFLINDLFCHIRNEKNSKKSLIFEMTNLQF